MPEELGGHFRSKNWQHSNTTLTFLSTIVTDWSICPRHNATFIFILLSLQLRSRCRTQLRLLAVVQDLAGGPEDTNNHCYQLFRGPKLGCSTP